MLGHGALVVAGLNFKPHLLQIQADLPAGGLAVVQGAQVKVRGLVFGVGGSPSILVGLKEEKFQLRADVEHIIAHGPGPVEHPAQHAPGIAHKGGAVCVVHIAEHAGHPPAAHFLGQDHKTVQVGV